MKLSKNLQRFHASLTFEYSKSHYKRNDRETPLRRVRNHAAQNSTRLWGRVGTHVAHVSGDVLESVVLPLFLFVFCHVSHFGAWKELVPTRPWGRVWCQVAHVPRDVLATPGGLFSHIPWDCFFYFGVSFIAAFKVRFRGTQVQVCSRIIRLARPDGNA